MNQLMSAPTNRNNRGKHAGQFNLIVNRPTYNIAGNLDFCLFGLLDIQNGYREIISLNAANSVQTEWGELGDQPYAVVMTYTKTASPNLVDTINIQCAEYPYPAFIQALASGVFKLSKLRVTLSDATQLTQFNNFFEVNKRTMFGKRESDIVTLTAYKSPDQFQNGIIDLDTDIDITQDHTLYSTMINAGENFTVTYSVFVEKIVHGGREALAAHQMKK